MRAMLRARCGLRASPLSLAGAAGPLRRWPLPYHATLIRPAVVPMVSAFHSGPRRLLALPPPHPHGSSKPPGKKGVMNFVANWLKQDHYIDEAAEIRRLDQRVVFDSERWRKHRNVTRFLRAIPIPLSAVMLQTIKPVSIVTLWTIAICAVQLVVDCFFFHLPVSLFSLSGPTLGLLLVFRTNASYERWDGARKMIGLVKNRTEDMVRQTCIWFPPDRPDLKQQMLRYCQAFFFALKVHLRSGPGGLENDAHLVADLTPILTPEELQLLLKAPNRPAHVLQCITMIIEAARLQSGRIICMDQNLTALADVLGGCERILRTPIPLSYTRMTTRFLLMWLFLLPLALSWEIVQLGCTIWLTPPCIIFLAFLLLGIDEVAVQIEEPFTILPLEAYAEGSRKNVTALFAQMHSVQGVVVPPDDLNLSPAFQMQSRVDVSGL